MRHAVAFAFAVAALAGCAKIPAPGQAGARHPWTLPHVLRVADISDPDHLNPYLSEMDVSYDLSSLVYSYLVVADARGRLTGDLATVVPSLANGGISRDGRTYVYHLRRNVVWHDGVAFGARDVVASWRAVMNPANDTFEHEGYDRVASVGAPNPYTVVVHLRERYPPFVSRFFAPLQEGAKPVLPAHLLSAGGGFNAGSLSSHPVGTGPFAFVSWSSRRPHRTQAFRPLLQGTAGARADRLSRRSERSDDRGDAPGTPNRLDRRAPNVARRSVSCDARRVRGHRTVELADVARAQCAQGRLARRCGASRDCDGGSLCRNSARRNARVVRTGAQQPAADRHRLRAAAFAGHGSGHRGERTAAGRLDLGIRRGTRARRRATGVYARDDCGLEQRRADRIARSVVVARGRHRGDDQDVSVSHDFRRAERARFTAATTTSRSTAAPSTGIPTSTTTRRAIAGIRKGKTSSVSAIRASMDSNAPGCKPTIRRAARRFIAGEPADVVGGSLRSRLRSAPLDRAFGRSAKLRREPDVDAVVERLADGTSNPMSS